MAVGSKIRSQIWGGKEFEVTQEFGTYDPATAGMYPGPNYTEPLGFPAGTHIGLDIAMPRGTPIYAINPGEVEFAGFSDSFRPNPVHIITKDNPDTVANEAGYREIYGHLWQNAVDTGDRVVPGKQIGISGEQTYRGTMNPDNTGPHLHFELHKPGEDTSSGFRAVNPTQWITGVAGVLLPEDQEEGTPDRDDNESPIDILGLAQISETVREYAQKSFFIIIGLAILIIGLNAVLNASGINVTSKATKLIPAARIARRIKK